MKEAANPEGGRLVTTDSGFSFAFFRHSCRCVRHFLRILLRCFLGLFRNQSSAKQERRKAVWKASNPRVAGKNLNRLECAVQAEHCGFFVEFCCLCILQSRSSVLLRDVCPLKLAFERSCNEFPGRCLRGYLARVSDRHLGLRRRRIRFLSTCDTTPNAHGGCNDIDGKAVMGLAIFLAQN